MSSNSVIRIRLLLILLCVWAIVLAVKLYSVQVVHGEEYIAQADRQYTTSTTSGFNRGSIFFESKDGERRSAASVKNGYTLVMNPAALQASSGDSTTETAKSAYEALSQYIKLDKDIFLQKAAKENDKYEEIQKKLDTDTGISIGELNIPGINVAKDAWMFYPGGSLSANTIGLVGYDSKNKMAGRYGLERFYENVLSRAGNNTNVNFFAQLFANIEGGDGDTTDGTINANLASKPGDIVASIDPIIENELEKELKDIQDVWKSDSIGGIIMDPKTGEIYAMASRPSFDPNDLSASADPRVFSNPLVENVYEMGSIIKPLTMAAGIDSGAVTLQTTYNDTGFLLLNGKRISNYDGRARGVIPMQEVLNQSLNIGAATVALKVGSEKFIKYFLSFGLGEPTGIDQPNEQKGIVENLKSGREIEQATASYGQGIALTPIETARALAILANGGHLLHPHIVKEIDYSDGSIKTILPDAGRQVIKKETADTVTGMLVKVVDTAIAKAHPDIHMERYSIAAKTGTAQIADHAHGGYYTDRYLHSFFGYFPAYNPRYIVFLYHVYPKGAEYASETLTEPFIKLTKFLINYNEIPPDR